MNNNLPDIPKNANELSRFYMAKINELKKVNAPYLKMNAFGRLVTKNIDYVINQKDQSFLQCWNTQEGRNSIMNGLEDALSLGASLPEMGCLVPFGGVVEFIPAVEAYEFALTNGKNPPFAWLNIECIYENDQSNIKKINGELQVEIQPGIPRGGLVAVVVYGKYNKSGKVIGDVYDKTRLLEKASVHSVAYKYYLQDLKAFEFYKTEGKIKIYNGREYFEKEIPGKGGNQSWKKKIFKDELVNPYEGPDQPEMLRKAAGKSFLVKYVKIRNSEAAAYEMNEEIKKQDKYTPDDILKSANDIYDNQENIDLRQNSANNLADCEALQDKDNSEESEKNSKPNKFRLI